MYYIDYYTGELFFFDDTQIDNIPSNLIKIEEPRPSPDHQYIDHSWVLVEDRSTIVYTLNTRDSELTRVYDLLDKFTVKQRNPIIKSYIYELKNIENTSNPAAVLSGLLEFKPREVIDN